MRGIAILLLSAGLTGCASINLCSDFQGVRVEDGHEPVATVEIANSGWYLFNCLPLGSGDPDHPDGGCRLFTDTVTLDNNLKVLAHALATTGAGGFCNLTSRVTEENYFFILVKHRIYRTSAVLLKKEEMK